ncbi:hypothetical protein ACYPKM_02350 [Pseudomonas aeruginosa]
MEQWQKDYIEQYRRVLNRNAHFEVQPDGRFVLIDEEGEHTGIPRSKDEFEVMAERLRNRRDYDPANPSWR